MRKRRSRISYPGYVRPLDEHDDVLAEAQDDRDEKLPFAEGDVENFVVIGGRVYHKPEPPARPKVGRIDI